MPNYREISSGKKLLHVKNKLSPNIEIPEELTQMINGYSGNETKIGQFRIH